jgi:hypothetical protein
MSTTLLVTVQDLDASTAVDGSGVEVLARYPDTVLVRATDDQADRLTDQGVEAVILPEQPVRVGGAEFAFEDAVQAQDAVSLDPAPGRTAYYLVKLAGPAAREWLASLGGVGATVHSSLTGFTLLVGVLPETVDTLRAFPWVVEVTPFRPAMKVSPKLRTDVVALQLDASDLARVGAHDIDLPDRQLVEVSVFAGESVNDVAATVRRAGGTVLESLPQSLVVNASAQIVAELADTQGILAILPHALPELHNDRATAVMGVPPDFLFAGFPLTGAGQLVGIADSGLDTGDPATIHDDVRGRVEGIVSWPTRSGFAPFVTDGPGSDDGAADVNSGHGTHVTGSVLGDGAAAAAAGVKPAPAGTAPEAHVFFQAVEQRVTWKSAAQLAAEGLTPPFRPWPPAPAGLYGLPDDLGALFRQAHAAGARVHTNSWGAPVGGVYNQNARAVDRFVWEHPDFLVLFSAGNSGVDSNVDGVIDADSVGSPGTAKNCLTVGASENNRPAGSQPKPGRDIRWDQFGSPLRWPVLHAAGHVSDDIDGMAPFSSRGPTDDGRIKPDVVAPGTNVLSLLSSVFPAARVPLWGRLEDGDPLRRSYCWSGGTSMSTPLVAGAAALVRQHLVERRLQEPGRTPSAALIKAVLIGGARPMPGQFTGEIPTGQNPVAGFGRVDVTGAVACREGRGPLIADAADDAVSTGEIRTYLLSGVDTSAALSVTLAWTDAPAPAGVGGLENQLYLQVTDPSGIVVNGDVTSFPHATNNVQQVMFDAPTAGEYRIRVRGISVTAQSPGAAPGAVPRQDFALAVSNGNTLSKA